MVKDSEINSRLNAGDSSRYNTGIVSALDLKGLILHSRIINCLLGLSYRRSGLESDSECYGHSGGNTAEDTAVIIRSGNNMTSVIDIELVVILRTCHQCSIKACAEFDTLNSRNTENKLSYRVFKAVKHRRTDAGRNIYSDTLDNAADTVLIVSGSFYLLDHLISLNVDNNRKILESYLSDRILISVYRIKVLVSDTMDLADVSANIDASLFKYLTCYRTNKAKGCCKPSGKMSAAPENSLWNADRYWE